MVSTMCGYLFIMSCTRHSLALATVLCISFTDRLSTSDEENKYTSRVNPLNNFKNTLYMYAYILVLVDTYQHIFVHGRHSPIYNVCISL